MNRYQSLKPVASVEISVENWLARMEDLFHLYSIELEKNDSLNRQNRRPFLLQIGMGLAEPLAAIYRFYHGSTRPPSPNRLPLGLSVFLIEPTPLTKEALSIIVNRLAGSPSETDLKPFLEAWPVLSPGLHRLRISSLNLELFFWFGSVVDGLRELDQLADYVCASSEMLTQKGEIHALARACRLNARLHIPALGVALSSVAKYAGLNQQSLDDYSLIDQPERSPKDLSQPKKIAVIGAGIAGTCVARKLCQAGVRVTLFEMESGPARGASGNWAGAFHPHITRDHTPLSQLTNLGCEYSLQALVELTQMGLLERGKDWDLPGHLQSMDDDKYEHSFESFRKLEPHPSWVQWKNEGEAFEGSPAGLWFELGAWVKPVRWVEANISACGDLLDLQYNSPIEKLPDGFDAIVVACAQHSLSIASAPGYRSNQVKGQVSLFRKNKPLPFVLSGKSYAIDANEEWVLLGATYERPVIDLEPNEQSDLENLSKFQTSYPNWSVGDLITSRCAVRSVWPDRLPAVGPVAGLENVYLCTGFASRGLTWAEMCASKLVADLHIKSVSPVSFSLFNKLNPDRYLQTERIDKL